MSENMHRAGGPDRAARAKQFGWWALSAWAVFGLALEAMHGFKVAGYLDDAWTRELLTLAHAHGVGLALLVLVWGEAGAPLFAGRSVIYRDTPPEEALIQAEKDYDSQPKGAE